MSGFLEGEYNNWRTLSWQTLHSWPVLMSYFNFFGAAFFFVGYISDINDFVSVARPDLETSLVADPFLAGSILFLAGSWMMQVMWKMQMFGLGFAHLLTHNRPGRKVDRKQQIMMVFYCLNLCIAWLTLAKVWGGDASRWYTDVGGQLWLQSNMIMRVVGYNCIIGLASAVHVIPNECPYPCLFWTMRCASVFDFVAQILWLAHENPLLFSG
eukprot:gnl/TRDRNA2_/TRDRNA2_208489_c0_seq1.p1 gnl/TRDRNA2_/TRDRNA2_208489_c0~~gnl/TRDRNA2_/TRDRNA2_208489_c0_seq1.p1  ORF type:complete len:236 (+),score=24.19 gnl/TRDRNA2_/TRDRNA2_208489_c0_seq1:74-709(+)